MLGVGIAIYVPRKNGEPCSGTDYMGTRSRHCSFVPATAAEHEMQ